MTAADLRRLAGTADPATLLAHAADDLNERAIHDRF